jgi:hypothetical protein
VGGWPVITWDGTISGPDQALLSPDRSYTQAFREASMSRKRNCLGQFSQEATCTNQPCQRCGQVFRTHKRRRKYCSAACYRAVDRRIDKQGYVVVKRPGHPHATTNGWVREHTVVVCAALGRSLLPDEVVHHKDHNRQNNSPDNLAVLTRSGHTRLHSGRPGNRQEAEPNPLVSCNCGCGAFFLKYDSRGRPRCYRAGHGRWSK